MVRYRGRLNEGGVVTVLVLPTDSGRALGVACSQPAADARCAALLATARLGAVRAVEPQPPAGVVRAVAQAIRDLEQARGIAGLRLAPAQQPKQGEDAPQSDAAQTLNELAGAYEQAATALGLDQGDAGTRAQLARVSDVLLNGRDAYERLSTAIDTEDPVLYRSARQAALRADRSLASALVRLRRAGYSVRLRWTRPSRNLLAATCVAAVLACGGGFLLGRASGEQKAPRLTIAPVEQIDRPRVGPQIPVPTPISIPATLPK